MAIAHSSHKFAAVLNLKQLSNGRFVSETTGCWLCNTNIWIQKWFKIFVGASIKLNT
jgi:hypothetical protein